MLAPRRFLPSTHALSAFEAAARTGSFTAAAREMHLTQSAVSRQIKGLEERLGVDLFLRERQTVRLTSAGEAYVRDVREALRIIATASLNLRANPHGGTLNLAILPTFGTRWLAPRLPDFLAGNTGVTVNLTTQLQPFDFGVERLDAAIHYGRPDWPGTGAAFLMRETVLPACAPAVQAEHRFASAAQLREAPLLHLATRPDAWERWLRTNGAPGEGVTGMVFDQFATLAQAAKHGLGVALLPEFLIARELADGDLVPALGPSLQSEEAYYLVWPTERGSYPPLTAFRDWIVAVTEGS